MAGTVVLIPARMGSTRLPGKPLADICGLPLILRVLHGAAGAAPERLAVATDSREIFETVTGAGFESVMTGPAENGTRRVYEAWKKMGRPGDRIINLQGDEPGADPSWIEALSAADTGPKSVSTLVNAISPERAEDPSVVKAVFTPANRALYFSRSPVPWGSRVFHQHLGVYCFTPESLQLCVHSPRGTLAAAEGLEQLSWMENGIGISVVPGSWNGMGVDTPQDLEEAREWFGKN